jgi:hypothetical protein
MSRTIFLVIRISEKNRHLICVTHTVVITLDKYGPKCHLTILKRKTCLVSKVKHVKGTEDFTM